MKSDSDSNNAQNNQALPEELSVIWQAFRSSPDALLLEGMEKQEILAANQAACQLLDLRPDQIHGLYLNSLPHGKTARYNFQRTSLQVSGRRYFLITARSGAENANLPGVLNQLLQTLSGEVSLSDALPMVLQLTLEAAGLDSGGIYLTDPESGDFILRAWQGLSDDFIQAVRVVPVRSPRWQIVQAGNAIYSMYDHIRTQNNPALINEGLRAIGLIPIMHQGKPVAGLNLASHTKDTISAESQAVIEQIALQVGSALSRMLAQEELKRSEERYQALFNQAHDAILLHNLDGRIIGANQRASEIFAYSRDELTRLSFRELTAELESSQQVMKQIVSGEFVPHYERLYLRKDGIVFPAEVHVELVRDEKGCPRHIQTVIREISERKRMEQALQESERFNQTVFDTLPASIAVLNSSGVIIKVNQAWRLYAHRNGAGSSTFLGVNYLDICDNTPPDSPDGPAAQAAAAGIRAVLYGSAQEYTQEYYCPVQSQPEWYNLRVNRFSGAGPEEVIISHENITPIKLEEITRREAESRFQLLYLNMPAPVSIFRAVPNFAGGVTEFIIEDVNDEMLKVFQMERSVFIGRRALQVFGSEIIKQFRDFCLSASSPGQFNTLETFLSGAERYFSTTVVLLAPGLFATISLDITASRKEGQILRDAQQRLMTLLDSIPAMVYVAGADASGDFHNQAWLDYTGMTREACQGFGWTEALHPDDRQRDQKEIEAAIRDEPSLFETEQRLRRFDGDYRWFLNRAMPVRDEAGKIVRWYGLCLDITERKASEEQLRVSEELYHSIFSQAVEAVSLTDEDGLVIEWNRASEEMTGLAATDVLGAPLWEIQIQMMNAEKRTPDLRARLRGEVEMVLRNGSGRLLRKIETWLPGRDALGKYVVQSIFAIPTSKGFRIAAITHDVTEARQAQAALKAAHDELEKRVLERTEELQAANRALGKALGARDEFMAAMSHELRTPLTGILGMSEALSIGLAGELSPRQAKYVQTIDQSGRRLLTLINEVLDYTHLQTGQLSLNRKPHNLEKICKASLAQIEAKASENSYRLSSSFQPVGIVILVDNRRIEQILDHLLDNALKFTPGFGTISLDVQGDAAAGKVYIRVRDSGIGIVENEWARIFEPFVQLDARLAREYSGTGLGLALVKALVELHHGSVEVSSAPNQGSVFTVTLPWDGAVGDKPTA